MGQQPVDCGAVEQAGIVVASQPDAVVVLGRDDAAVEAGRSGVHVGQFHLDIRKFESALGGVLHGKADLEDRVATRVARHAQVLHQPLERQVLVRERVERLLPDLPQQVGKAWVVPAVRAVDQRVEEQAYEVVELWAAPVGDRRAGDYVRLAGVPVQQRVQRRQQDHERRPPHVPGEGAHTLGQVGGNAVVGDTAGRYLLTWPGPVRRQLHRRQVAGQTGPPVGQLPLGFACREPLGLPGSRVHIGQCRLRKVGGLAPAGLGVRPAEVTQQDADRPAVPDDVVQGTHEQVVGGVQPQKMPARGWVDGEVEADAYELPGQPHGGVGDVLSVHCRHVGDRQLHVCGTEPLHRSVRSVGDTDVQLLVAASHRNERGP